MAATGMWFTTTEGEKHQWQCTIDRENENTPINFRWRVKRDLDPSLTSASLGFGEWQAAPEIKSWGEVAHRYGEETVLCKHCGLRGELRWHENINEVLKRLEECFLCNFWMNKVREVNAETGRRLLIDASFSCHSIGKEPAHASGAMNKSMLGYGGARFEFEMLETKERIVSHNVWFGGIVPKRFRDKLPQNCIIIPNPPGVY